MGKVTILVLVFFIFLFPRFLKAAEPLWELIGPGDVDQASSLNVMKNGNIFVGTDVGGLYRSIDRGETWEALNNGLKNYDITTPVIEDARNPRILYVGTRGGFYKSTNGGLLWQNKRNGLRPVSDYDLSGSIGSVGIDPFDSRVLFLGFGYRPSSDGTSLKGGVKGGQGRSKIVTPGL